MILNIPRTLNIDFIINQDDEKLQIRTDFPREASIVVPRADEMLAIDSKSFNFLKTLRLSTISGIADIVS